MARDGVEVLLAEPLLLQTTIQPIRGRKASHVQGPVDRGALASEAGLPLGIQCEGHDAEGDSGFQPAMDRLLLETGLAAAIDPGEVDQLPVDPKPQGQADLEDLTGTLMEAREAAIDPLERRGGAGESESRLLHLDLLRKLACIRSRLRAARCVALGRRS